MIPFDKHPKVTGMTLEGFPTYDLPTDLVMPFPRNPLVPIRFGGMTELDVVMTMTQRKAAFEADQAVNSKNPGVWENLGYVVEGNLITAYYQIGFPAGQSLLRDADDPYRYVPQTPATPQRPFDGPRRLWGHEPYHR